MKKLLIAVLLFVAGCASSNYIPFKYETYRENPNRVYDSICTTYGLVDPIYLEEWPSFEIYTPSANKMIRTRYWVGKSKSDTINNKFIFTFEEPDSILTIRIEK